jgi:hypothetical protein
VNSTLRSGLLGSALFWIAAAAPGCTTVPHPDVSMEAFVIAERQVFGDAEAHEFAKRLQVRLPAKLAVADVSERASGGREERRLVQAVNGLAEDDTTFTDVVSLTTDGTRSLDTLRHQAATHQADLELIVLRHEEIHSNSTGLGLLNVLIVPMFVVPTQSNDVHLTVRAMVRDVRNGLVYTTFDDHGEATVWSSLAGESSHLRRASDALYDECIARMRTALARKLTALERASN